jgi:hypothetical protein
MTPTSSAVYSLFFIVFSGCRICHSLALSYFSWEWRTRPIARYGRSHLWRQKLSKTFFRCNSIAQLLLLNAHKKGLLLFLALLSLQSEVCTQFWRWTLWTPHWGIMILLCSIAQLHLKVFLIGTNNILWNCGYFAMWCKLCTPLWYMGICNDLDDTQLIYLELQWRHARINNPYLYIIRWHINAK